MGIFRRRKHAAAEKASTQCATKIKWANEIAVFIIVVWVIAISNVTIAD